MYTRVVKLPSGAACRVPAHIQRIDTRSTHGWQLRYGKPTKFFSDSIASSPRAALKVATEALLQRIAELPAATGLQRGASANKSNDLPVGVSGPILRNRGDRPVPECHFSVLLPVFGATPLRRSVYIANKNTYNAKRYKDALAKAIAMRKAAEVAYQDAATAAIRKAAKRM